MTAKVGPFDLGEPPGLTDILENHGPLLEDAVSTATTPELNSAPPIPSPQATSVRNLVPGSTEVRPTGWRRILPLKSGKSKKKVAAAAATDGKGLTCNSEVEILKSDEIEAELARQKQGGKALQKSTWFHQRVHWQRHHKEALRSTIEEIRHGNNDLESLLQLCAPKDSCRVLPCSDNLEALWPVINRIEQALGSLHEDLMVVNVGTESRGPCVLSLQLKEDHDENRRDLEQDSAVRLRPSSFVFNVQRHSFGSGDGGSSLLLVETASAKSSAQPLTSKSKELHSLNKPTELGASPSQQLVEQWGYFPAQGSENLHIVYHDTQGQWSSQSSLVDILSGKDFHQRISPVQVVQLARMITSAHLHLAQVRGSCVNPRPANFRFYRTSDEEDVWNDSMPLVLRPWISFGFGQRPPPRKLGGGSGPARASNTSMIELGLLLYQIGSGTNLDYGLGVSGLAAAKAEALKNLNILDRRIGTTYVDIVRHTLEFKARASYLTVGSVGKDEAEYVKKAISSLVEYEEVLEDTVVAPNMILVSEEQEDVLEEITTDLPNFATQTDNTEVHVHLQPQADNNPGASSSDVTLMPEGPSSSSKSTSREPPDQESLRSIDTNEPLPAPVKRFSTGEGDARPAEAGERNNTDNPKPGSLSTTTGEVPVISTTLEVAS
jgi:hypothetical protein